METQDYPPLKYKTLKNYTKLDEHDFLKNFIKKTERKFLTAGKYYDIIENFDNETEARKAELVKFVEAKPVSLRQKITNILKLN
jgi:hypothetical protein